MITTIVSNQTKISFRNSGNIFDYWNITRIYSDRRIIFIVSNKSGHPSIKVVDTRSNIVHNKVAIFICSGPELVALVEISNLLKRYSPGVTCFLAKRLSLPCTPFARIPRFLEVPNPHMQLLLVHFLC